MSKEGGTPWPVWATVTILVALIGTFGKLLIERPSASNYDRSAGEQPSVHAPPPASVAARTDWVSRLGLYAGESLNRTGYARGATLLDLKAVDPSGKVRGAIEWSQGLYGSGTLVGTAADNTMDLSGTIMAVETGIWECDLRLTFTSANAIRGTYRLYPRPGNPNGTQDGEFTLTRFQ